MSERRIAHYRAYDLAAALVRETECFTPALLPHKRADVDRVFCELAKTLGYVVTPEDTVADETPAESAA